MNKFMKKNIILVLLFMLLLAIISPSVLAGAASGGSEYRSKMDTLINNQDSGDDNWKDNSSASGKVEKVMNAIIVIIRIVGMCIAVTMLLVLAMKYMMASPGEKADIKRSSTAYIVGALVLFGAVGILGIIGNFAAGNIKKT